LINAGGACVGCGISVVCNVILAILFLPGILKPEQTISFIVFVFLHAGYWFGINGVMFPLAASMMPDISEIYTLRTGVSKDGSYAAMLSFITKLAYGIGITLTGFLLGMIGYDSSPEVTTQSEEVLFRMCVVALLVGPFISLLSLIPLWKYPVNKAYLEKLRSEK